jgi:potassium voltage-gated channel Eag-related subfamily H protein 7
LLTLSSLSFFQQNRVVDLIFLQDLFQQFMTPYYNEDQGGWVIQHSMIAKHYATGWFPVDFVSIIPFGIIGRLMDSQEIDQLKILRIIRLLRLAKLLRIFKSSAIVKRYQSHVGISHATQTMIKFAFLIFAVAHWLACMWGIVTTIDTTERYGQKVNWMSDYALWDQIQGNPYRIYLSSLYWATMTVTTIGYGDIRPTNEAEQILCTVGMLVGASAYAYVIGNVCGVIALMDQATSK